MSPDHVGDGTCLHVAEGCRDCYWRAQASARALSDSLKAAAHLSQDLVMSSFQCTTAI